MFLGYASYNGIELFNSSRQMVYHELGYGQFGWLRNCDPCPAMDVMLPSGLIDGGIPGANLTSTDPLRKGKYVHPQTDPAPWIYGKYQTVNSADLIRFFGMSLLSITGVGSSTRSVDVVTSLTSGAVLGKSRYAPREMVFTILATGLDRPAVYLGFEYLKSIAETRARSCDGAELHLYAACPCLCEETIPALGSEAADCAKECIEPYLRRLTGVVITSGPTLLEWHNVSCGAAATIEWTMTAGSPQWLWGPASGTLLVSADVYAGDPHEDSRGERLVLVDPWTQVRTVVEPAALGDVPSRWWRTPLMMDSPTDGLPAQVMLRLDAFDDAPGGVRISLLEDRQLLGSWFVRRMPAGGGVDINLTTGQTVVTYQGRSEVRGDVVLGGDGGHPVWLQWPVRLKAPSLLVDRADAQARLQVDVRSVGVL